jgi:hypothetical protein
LCHEVHPLRIHAILIRKVRTEEEENTDILIVSIYCGLARKRGEQYTKRILPPFVIPHCNITLENVLLYVARHPRSQIDYDDAAHILGSYDARTIRKHIRLVRSMISEANLWIFQRLAGLWGYGRLPELKPGESEWEHLGRLVAEASKTTERIGELEADSVEPIVFVHAVYVSFKSRMYPWRAETALSRDPPSPLPCDSS